VTRIKKSFYIGAALRNFNPNPDLRPFELKIDTPVLHWGTFAPILVHLCTFFRVKSPYGQTERRTDGGTDGEDP